MRNLWALAVFSTFVSGAGAQTSPPRVVRATGNAVVSVQPDLAKINVGVVTQAATAEQAASQNATKVEAVLARLREVLGSTGTIKTISYSITPNYRRSQDSPPVLTDFTASNTVEVSMNDLSLIGRVIDAASQAGSNSVQGLRFTVNDPEPYRARALAQAAKQARAHAEAIATGLGGKVGTVLAAQEGGTIIPVEVRTAVGAQTPIEAGLVEIQATVSVEVELL